MFSITTELPIYYSIICILLGVVYAYFLYRKNKFFSKKLTILLFLFRALVVSVLAFLLLLNPLSSVTNTIEEKPIIILAEGDSVNSLMGYGPNIIAQNLEDLEHKVANIKLDINEYNKNLNLTRKRFFKKCKTKR